MENVVLLCAWEENETGAYITSSLPQLCFSLFYRWYREVVTEPKPQNHSVAINRTQISLELHIICSCFWGDMQIIERHLDCISSTLADCFLLNSKYFTSVSITFYCHWFTLWGMINLKTFSSGNCHFKWTWHNSIKISLHTYLYSVVLWIYNID